MTDSKPKPLSLDEARAVLSLLAEALPMALAHLKAGQMTTFDQWAFWQSFIKLNDVWDGELVSRLDTDGVGEMVEARSEAIGRLQWLADGK